MSPALSPGAWVLDLFRLDRERILDKAARAAGFSFADDAMTQGLDRLIASLVADSGLNPFGAFALNRTIQRMAESRFRVEKAIAERPEILEEPITEPVVHHRHAAVRNVDSAGAAVPGRRAPLAPFLGVPAAVPGADAGRLSGQRPHRRHTQGVRPDLQAGSGLQEEALHGSRLAPGVRWGDGAEFHQFSVHRDGLPARLPRVVLRRRRPVGEPALAQEVPAVPAVGWCAQNPVAAEVPGTPHAPESPVRGLSRCAGHRAAPAPVERPCLP